jgi:hypothetical protein
MISRVVFASIDGQAFVSERFRVAGIKHLLGTDPFTARRGLRTLSNLYDDRFILGLVPRS